MPTKKTQASSHKTIHRLCVSGILIRIFRGMRTKGVTIESVGPYEAGLEYRALRERGHVSALLWAAKDQSPLNYLLVMRHYPKAGVKQ